MRAIRHVCLTMCWFVGVHAYGQFSTAKPDMVEFRGRVAGGGYSSYDNLAIEITSLRDRTLREHVDVASDGSFGFRAIPQGDYELRVTSIYGTELVSTIESIGPGSPPAEIRLQEPKLEKPVSGIVSVKELIHPPSKQVRKLLDSGHKLFEAEHYDDAVARFREAAKDDPECPEAHADLGMALTKTGDWVDATQEYRAAVVLDPTNSVLHSNLSAALAVQKRYGEAQNEAFAALKLDSRNARAHYVMGAILLQTQGSLPAAVAHLVASENDFPSVKETVAKICSANHVSGCP
jgi:tetratricopeptide (TPR) repeat protein